MPKYDFRIEAPVKSSGTAGPRQFADLTSDPANAGIHAWNNPANAQADDDAVADTGVMGIAANSEYLKGLNPGFPGVPNTADVTEVRVRVRRHESLGAGTLEDQEAKLVVGGVVQVDNQAKVGGWPLAEEETVYTLAVALTGAQIRAADFGFVLSGVETTGVGAVTGNVDSMTIEADWSD